MISAYLCINNSLILQQINKATLPSLNNAFWIDLLSPTKEEEAWVEEALAMQIPTQEEMREIELSSRLYIENNTLYMTAIMVAQSASLNPLYDAVTFALTPSQLITIRYIEPQAFKLVTNNLLKPNHHTYHAEEIFLSLLEATVDRLADVLEYVGHHLDAYANIIFQHNFQQEKLDYQVVMQNIGTKSNLNTKARESLVTFSRLIAFFEQMLESSLTKETRARLATLHSDLNSLSDYANFISNKINFLLEATLGMISIEQSAIIKIFSVAAVIFLPPTLIASVYGMNFQFMPELHYKWGYLIAVGLMLFSAWVPYKYFKYKKWL